MYCILDENIALRSWQRTPYAYYIKHERDAKRLTKAEYELLSRCDGRQDIPESELLNALIGHGAPLRKGRAALPVAEHEVREPLLPRNEPYDNGQMQL